MRLSDTDLRELADLAIRAAGEAGDMISRSRPLDVQHKTGAASAASQVVTEIDRRSEDMILDALAPSLERFELGLLTEERDDDGGRLTSDHFWCIDPLDGTLPFVEGVPGYAVSIALVRRDGAPLIGVVHDPVEGTLLHAIAGAGAFRDGTPFARSRAAHGRELSVFVDHSFLTSDHRPDVLDGLAHIADNLGLDGLDVREPRGAVMNAVGVLDGPPGCYVKFPKPSGGGSLWDMAATACLFDEAGAVASDIHGARLDLNRADSTFMHHRGVLYATDDSVARQIRAFAAGR